MLTIATIRIPSLDPVGMHSLSAALLLSALALAALLFRRWRKPLETVAPAILLAAGILHGRYVDWFEGFRAQHIVALFVDVAGIVGFSLYCVRKYRGIVRVWGGVFLVIGIVLTLYAGGSMLADGNPFYTRNALFHLMIGSAAAVGLTWLFWLAWGLARRHVIRPDPTRFPILRPTRSSIISVCLLWAVLASAWAFALAARWRTQGPAVRIAESTGGHMGFRSAGGLEWLFPPPVEFLNLLDRLQVGGKHLGNSDIGLLSRVDWLDNLYIYDAPGVTDQGARQLANLRRLRTLGFWNTGVTHEGIVELKKVLPRTNLYGTE